MGKWDSSLTRVVPVFDAFMDINGTGSGWLDRLLGLFEGGPAQEGSAGTLIQPHPKWWGSNERRLPAPLPLLEWLARNITLDAVAAAEDRPEVQRRREGLAKKDPATVDEAIRRLRRGERGRRWFVLEGTSRPDAVLETSTHVVVIEGKRTERSTTVRTKWMPTRSQLLRHMDAALEIAKGRRVLGGLIVESGNVDSVEPTAAWRRAAGAQVSDTVLKTSLPHRSADVRRRIRQGVLGITTWQRICQEFQITLPAD